MREHALLHAYSTGFFPTSSNKVVGFSSLCEAALCRMLLKSSGGRLGSWQSPWLAALLALLPLGWGGILRWT